MQKGYMMNGLLLRPSMVVVGKASNSVTLDSDEPSEIPVDAEIENA